jgi:hypothetical protein
MVLPRKLAFRDRFVYDLVQEMGLACDDDPIVFPDHTTKIKFVVEMNENEFTAVLSALMTGADLSYPDDAHAVVWYFLRQLECPVSLCDELIECLQPLFDALETKLDSIETKIDSVQETLDENAITPPEPIEETEAGKRCGGAAFVVGYMNSEIRRVYAEAEEGLLDNLIEATVEVLRAIPVIETLPIDEMLNAVNLYFENQVADYIDDYDTLYDDLVGSLACFIEANDNTFDYQVWGDWLVFVGEEYPTNRAAKLFSAFAPLRQTFLSDILAGIFNRPTLSQFFDMVYVEYAAGSQVAIACPTYECPVICFEVFANIDPSVSPFGQDSGLAVVSGTEYTLTADGTWNYGSGTYDAEGQIGTSGNPSAINPSGNLGQLIWKVGSGGTWQNALPVIVIDPMATGNLFFALNDVPGTYADNSGSLCVSIEEVP